MSLTGDSFAFLMENLPLAGVFFLSGLGVGFGHCVGMCGPLAVTLTLALRDRPPLRPHLWYTAGRVCTYMMLGALVGAAGSLTIVAANMVRVQRIVMAGTGVLIMVMGWGMTGWGPGWFGRAFSGEETVVSGMGAWGKAMARLRSGASDRAYFPLGMFLGLLPCGPVYTALLSASGAAMTVNSAARDIFRDVFQQGTAGGIVGGVVTGMVLMAAFGLGTAPAMILVGRLSAVARPADRHRFYRIAGLLMTATGAVFLARALR